MCSPFSPALTRLNNLWVRLSDAFFVVKCKWTRATSDFESQQKCYVYLLNEFCKKKKQTSFHDLIVWWFCWAMHLYRLAYDMVTKRSLKLTKAAPRRKPELQRYSRNYSAHCLAPSYQAVLRFPVHSNSISVTALEEYFPSVKAVSRWSDERIILYSFDIHSTASFENCFHQHPTTSW